MQNQGVTIPRDAVECVWAQIISPHAFVTYTALLAATDIEEARRETGRTLEGFRRDISQLKREGLIRVEGDRAVVLGGSASGVTLLTKFDEFWKNATKKAGKRDARAAYKRALQEGNDEHYILECWKRHNAVWAQWPDSDKRYIPNPSTWLNDGRWEGADPEQRGSSGVRVARTLWDVFDDQALVDAAQVHLDGVTEHEPG